MSEEEIIYIQYARKSSEEENRQSLSIHAQLRDNDERIIAKLNPTVYKTITDEASASIPYNRPGYAEMIRLIKAGKANGIIVWHIDRLVRNELEDGEFRWLLRTGKIRSILTPSREYRSEDNTLLLGIETSMASQFTIELARKIRNSNKQMWRERGQPGGFAKVGYLNTKFQQHGTNYIIEDPERFHLMRKGFDVMLTGKYSVPEVHAKLANEIGLRTRKTKKLGGNPVSLPALYRIFTDIFYAGYFYRKGTLYKGQYEPMITVEEFEKIQRILGRPGKPMQQKHEFAFTGLMRCGSCGCAITASRKLKRINATGEYRTYTFYHCTKRKGMAACGEKHYVTEKEMTELIAAELSRLSLIPKWKGWVANIIADDYETKLTEDKKVLQSSVDLEHKLKRAVSLLIDLRVSEELSEEEYKQKRAGLDMELIVVREKIKRMEDGIDTGESEMHEIANFVEDAGERFINAGYKEQRGVCSFFGWNWQLQGKKLTFTRQEWFYDMEQVKAYYEANKVALEPIKTYTEYKQSPYFENVLLILRRMRERIRTDDAQKIRC